MDRLVIAGLMNGALAALLALVALAATRAWRNPYFGRIAWLAVLLKLVTPPLLLVPVEAAWLGPAETSPRVATNRLADSSPKPSLPERKEERKPRKRRVEANTSIAEHRWSLPKRICSPLRIGCDT